MAIYRTYGCNECDIEFTTADEEPACLKCQGEVAWIPQAGHGGIISGSTRSTDAYFRHQAQRYGMSDLHSARAGEAMAPRPKSPSRVEPFEIMPGIKASIPLDGSGQPISGVMNFKPTAGMQPSFGNGLPVSGTPSLQSITEVVGRYDGRK